MRGVPLKYKYHFALRGAMEILSLTINNTLRGAIEILSLTINNSGSKFKPSGTNIRFLISFLALGLRK